MKLNNFLYDLSLINVFNFTDEQRDGELFFKVSVYDVIINIKDVIEDESSNVMIAGLIKVRVINERA